MRGVVFRGLDHFRGSTVARHVAELERAVADPDYALCLRRQRLENLLSLARRSTEYYSWVEESSLDHFPVVTKNDLRARLDALKSSEYSGRLWTVTSSGSHGAPFTYFHGDTKRIRKRAELVFFNGVAGYRVGDYHVLMRTTRKSRLKCIIQNEKWISPMIIDEKFLRKLSSLIQSRWGRIVIGYPSAMVAAAHYWKKECTDAVSKTKSFISTSEAISENDKNIISEVFGCVVYSRYASEEFGIIGHELPDMKGHAINPTGLYVEALDLHSHERVGIGGVGRLVVTDLFSTAYPLIRYDIGDLAQVKSINDDGSVGAIGTVEGKLIEAISDTSGRWVSPHSIPVALKDLEGIHQFQFVQCGRAEYEVRCVAQPQWQGEGELRRRLRQVLGADSNIQVVYVDEIPPLPSGKRPFVLNEWSKGNV